MSPPRMTTLTWQLPLRPQEVEDDEEEFSDRADDFEREYNFRFEEEGATQVAGHARHDPTSMRRQTKLSRKSEQTEQRKERRLEVTTRQPSLCCARSAQQGCLVAMRCASPRSCGGKRRRSCAG